MARAANIPASSSPPRAGRGRPRATETATTAAAADAKAAALSKPRRGRPPKARTAAEPKKSTVLKPTASSVAKRNNVVVNNDNDDDDMTDDEIGSIVAKQKTKPASSTVGRAAATTTKATSRVTKTAKSSAQIDSDDDDELAQPEIPKRKVGRPPKTRPVEKETSTTPEVAAPRPRGRPRLNAAKAPAAGAGAGTQRKATTTRTAATANTEARQTGRGTTLSSLSSVKSSFLKEPAKKKKVTFQDLIDSDDDIPVVAESVPAKKSTAASTMQSGLKAKPVRKAAGSGRGRKPAAAKDTIQPLSPKKATQVAKSNSHAGSDNPDDDELSSAKVEEKALVKSPIRQSENTVLASPIKRINFAAPGFSPRPKASEDIENNENATLRSSRPVEFGDARFMASPARRLPSSPFHFTMKETPRRTMILNKDHADPSAHPEPAALRASPLKASPKKGPLFKQPAGNSPSSSPFKLSLLKSPAKRVCSPFKLALSPEKDRFPKMGDNEDAAETDMISGHRDDGSPRPIGYRRSESVQAKTSDGEVWLDDPFVDAPAPVETEEEALNMEDEEMPQQQHVTTEAEQEDLEEPVEPAEVEMHQNDLRHHHFEVEEAQDEQEAEEPHQIIEVPLETNGGNENVVIEELHLSSPSLNLEVFEAQEHLIDRNSPERGGSAQKDGEEGQEEEREEENEEINGPEELHELAAEELRLDDAVDGPVEQHARSSAEPEMEMQGVPEHQGLTKEEMLQEERHEDEEAVEQPEQITEESMDVEDADDDAVMSDSGIPSPYREPTTFETEGGAYDNEGSEEQEVMQAEEEGEEPPLMLEKHLENQENLSPAVEQTGVSSPFSEARMIHLSSPASSVHHSYETEENMEEVQHEPQHIQPSPTMSPAKEVTYEPREEDDAESDTDPVVDTLLFDAKRARRSQVFVQPATPGSVRQRYNEDTSIIQGDDDGADLGFTPLAAQLSEWKASTPVESQPRRPRRRGVFSLAGNPRSSLASTRKSTHDHRYRLRESSSTFRRSSLGLSMFNLESLEDEQEATSAPSVAEIPDAPSPVRELDNTESLDKAEADNAPSDAYVYSDADEAPELENEDLLQEPEEHITDELVHSIQESLNQDIVLQSEENVEAWDKDTASEQEDEPAEPLPSAEEDKENDEMAALSLPSTPKRATPGHLRTVHTVSKVPLRPEGVVSPLKVSRKRARSLSSGPATRASPRIRAAMTKSQTSPAVSPRKHSLALRPSQPEYSDQTDEPARADDPPTSAKSRRVSSPVDPFHDAADVPQVLKGVAAFVDVHTTEGEDASGIFIELLTQMGARCVKSWSWNPRASLSPVDGAEPKENRVGITHVIYKDGGVRTLEKVRQAGGLVKCVGVSWVLDCERENRWLDEAHYLVDSSIIPRGGAKRRKSMQPRSLSNVNGTLVKADGPAYPRAGRVSGVDRESVREFIRLTPPSPAKQSPNYQDTFSTPAKDTFSGSSRRLSQQPSTPGQSGFDFNFDFDPSSFSPTTPYYLSKGAKLVQQTCPPKQTREGLFPISGRIEDESSSKLRAKLEAARRKSLAFKPRRESPLKK
ncbi:hypothetical protein DTO207G8_3946 [Paecilomyces variotii]|nr:hypothetical protein DTO207G8_3946 [Paecilomyces variotii]KAJ9368374.1 hypothetical protein DTO282E5_6967 [Paecilomyces variotii]KAJ9392642.1 hypothetical protein DTO063F5_442 [Paecilomyces variotii]KAJ9409445.1 hypothetical protein DTO045G8_2800 [Paecilomyces variotii]